MWWARVALDSGCRSEALEPVTSGAARVKESELLYLKKEVQCLRDELR